MAESLTLRKQEIVSIKLRTISDLEFFAENAKEAGFIIEAVDGQKYYFCHGNKNGKLSVRGKHFTAAQVIAQLGNDIRICCCFGAYQNAPKNIVNKTDRILAVKLCPETCCILLTTYTEEAHKKGFKAFQW